MASNVGEVYLKGVRLSFGDGLFAASAFEEGGEKKYSASFLIDMTTSEGKKLKAACEAAANAMLKEKFGAKAKTWDGMAKNDCFFDGNDKEYDGYADTWVVAAKNPKRVAVYSKSKEVLTEDDMGDEIYSGCLVDAIVAFYVPKDPKYHNRLCCALRGVKVRSIDQEKYPSFGAGRVSADRFEDDEEDDL